MNNISLKLPLGLDIDKNTIIEDTNPTAVTRNSWLFKNQLGPLYKSTTKGFPTTKHSVYVDNDNYIIDNKEYLISDDSKRIKSITKITDAFEYNVVARSLNGTIYKSNNNIYLYNYSNSITVTGNSAAIYKDYAAVQYNTTIDIYQLSTLTKIKSITNANFKDINQFIYISSSFYALGYDDSDATKCWSSIVAGSTAFYNEYQGCLDYIDNKIILTGQPVYKMDASKTTLATNLAAYKKNLNANRTMLCPHTVMDNGTIKWNLLAQYQDPNNTPTETQVSTYSDLEELTTLVDNTICANKTNTESTKGPSYITCFISGITEYNSDGTVDWPDIKYSFVEDFSNDYNIPYCTYDSKEGWTGGQVLPLINPNTNPGVFWTTDIGEYESGPWFRDIFTNIQTDRGSIYDWGKGWSRHYSQRVKWQYQFVLATSQLKFTDYTSAQYRFTALLYAPLWFITNDTGIWFDTTAEENTSTSAISSLNGIIGENTYYSNCYESTSDSLFSNNLVDGDGNIAYVTSQITISPYYSSLGTYARFREIGYQEYSTHEYEDFIHLIGDSNSGDKGQVNTFPLVFNDDNYTRNYYNGIFTSVVKNGVLINTSTDDGITYYDSGADSILIDDRIIEFNDSADVYFSKLSEYTTTSNLFNNDIILENRTDSNIKISAAYLSSMGVVLDNTLALARFWSPTSISNNNLLYAHGINENMNDPDYRSSSYLLPEITIPLYTHTSQLNKLEQYKKEHNCFINPLVETSNKLDVYYTYTLLSTDNNYKYSIKDNSTIVDSKLKDNTWYINSETFYYPVGIIDALSVRNNNSTPFIELNNYSVELYEKDGYKTLVINPTLSELSIEAVFTIYSSTYFFDGQSIYYRNGDSNTFVVDALGLEFLANSGTEAYFYSNIDKTIYVFTGSTTISPLKKIDVDTKILSTVYSPSEQSLYILFNNGLYRRHEDEESFIELSADYLVKTENGVAIVKDNEFYNLYSWFVDNAEKIALEYSTPWIGNFTKLFKFEYLDIIANSNSNISVTLETLYDNGSRSSFELQKNKGDFYRYRVTPKDVKGNAFRFSIKSDSIITAILIGAEPISNEINSVRV